MNRKPIGRRQYQKKARRSAGVDRKNVAYMTPRGGVKL